MKMRTMRRNNMKQITLDDNFKQEAIKKFTDYINGLNRYPSNRIDFTTEIENTTKTLAKPTIYISATAYLKMMLYVRDTATEIAWHGTVERNIKANWYFIKDVFLYPQIDSAATVDTDQEKYQEWLMNIEDDEVFNNIRFQGHSHVNMGTSPSSTDLNMYETFLQVLPKNDYYIFMIMNKSGDLTSLIYDLEKNTIFESEDINIKILCTASKDLIADIDEEKEKYCEKPRITTYNYSSRDYDDMFLYGRSSFHQSTGDVNELIDEIDKKYKNPRLSLTKNKRKSKV